MPVEVLLCYAALACWIVWWYRRGPALEGRAFFAGFLTLLLASFAFITWLIFFSPLFQV